LRAAEKDRGKMEAAKQTVCTDRGTVSQRQYEHDHQQNPMQLAHADAIFGLVLSIRSLSAECLLRVCASLVRVAVLDEDEVEPLEEGPPDVQEV